MQSSNKKASLKPSRSAILCSVTAVNIGLFCCSVYFYVATRHGVHELDYHGPHSVRDSRHETVSGAILGARGDTNPAGLLLIDPDQQKDNLPSNTTTYNSLESGNISSSNGFSVDDCLNPIWCDIPMPTVSYYNFDPPTDIRRWKIAQQQAANGEQVLLKRIRKVFPGHNNFIDGDIAFRKLHSLFDFFIDEKRDLSPLVPSSKLRHYRRRLQKTVITAPKQVNGKLMYPWEQQKMQVIPEPYDFRSANRSAVVSIGYTAFQRDSSTYFTGNRLGGAFIDRKIFFRYWRKVKDKIDIPFIAICTLNENWGMLSTMFPNRTAGWGRCCNTPKDKEVMEFLDHDKTLMLVTNQHVNVSHPKLLIMPRGIPLTWGFTRVIIWDAMRNTEQNVRKQKLLFAAGSSWGPRPQILRCVSDRVPADIFDGHVDNPKNERLGREQYYQKLGGAMFGLGLPGLGYDCFRYVLHARTCWSSNTQFSFLLLVLLLPPPHVPCLLVLLFCLSRSALSSS